MLVETTPWSDFQTKAFTEFDAQGSAYVVTYNAAPWWEQAVFDGGEKIVRGPDGDVKLSGYLSRITNSLIVSIISTVRAVSMGTLTATGFSRFK